MKLKLLWLTGVVLLASAAFAQDVSGDWQGALEIGRRKLLIIVKITKVPNGWSAKMYSPEGGNDVGRSTRMDSVTLQGQDLRLTATAVQFKYDGKLSADGNSIEGTWAQGPPNSLSRPLSLQRATPETAWKDPSPHTSNFVTVDKDVQLEVLDWGGTGKPLVFLAGLANSAHVFDKFAPKFTSTHHVYAISRRGFGE